MKATLWKELSTVPLRVRGGEGRMLKFFCDNHQYALVSTELKMFILGKREEAIDITLCKF